jgi:hypothetical protein
MTVGGGRWTKKKTALAVGGGVLGTVLVIVIAVAGAKAAQKARGGALTGGDANRVAPTEHKAVGECPPIYLAVEDCPTALNGTSGFRAAATPRRWCHRPPLGLGCFYVGRRHAPTPPPCSSGRAPTPRS